MYIEKWLWCVRNNDDDILLKTVVHLGQVGNNNRKSLKNQEDQRNEKFNLKYY